MVREQVSLDARKAVLKHLETGPMRSDDLRLKIVGKRPDKPEEQREYDTRYQALRRALQSLVDEGVLEQPKYRLRGEIADQKYVSASIRRFKETRDTARQRLLMEDIEAECRRREAILTPGLLVFLKKRLSDVSEETRKLALSSLGYITSRIDESRREDSRHLRRLKEDYTTKLLKIASGDPSVEVRIEALKLLIELGEPKTINVIQDLIANSAPDTYLQFKYTLRTDLCNPYSEDSFSKNRLLRDHKDRLRNAMTDLRTRTDDARIQKRAQLVLWKIRYGVTSTMSGEETVD